MLVRTLTRAAGRLNFEPGVEIDLPTADAQELAAAGAVQVIEPTEEPKPEAKRPPKRD